MLKIHLCREEEKEGEKIREWLSLGNQMKDCWVGRFEKATVAGHWPGQHKSSSPDTFLLRREKQTNTRTPGATWKSPGKWIKKNRRKKILI